VVLFFEGGLPARCRQESGSPHLREKSSHRGTNARREGGGEKSSYLKGGKEGILIGEGEGAFLSCGRGGLPEEKSAFDLPKYKKVNQSGERPRVNLAAKKIEKAVGLEGKP